LVTNSVRIKWIARIRLEESKFLTKRNDGILALLRRQVRNFISKLFSKMLKYVQQNGKLRNEKEKKKQKQLVTDYFIKIDAL
jgi:regulator of PEP synthase PpsR (kinase-PPPase family)